MSVLMAAAGAGHADVVRLLLEEGAPWNAVDREHRCAGDYAARNGRQEVIDLLMQHACTCELLLGTVMKVSAQLVSLRTSAPLSPVAFFSPAAQIC